MRNQFLDTDCDTCWAASAYFQKLAKSKVFTPGFGWLMPAHKDFILSPDYGKQTPEETGTIGQA